MVLSRKASVAIHYEGYMARDWTLSQSSDEQVPDFGYGPFRRRTLEDIFAEFWERHGGVKAG